MALGVRLDEKDVIEFRWARQDTHLHLEAVAGAIGMERLVMRARIARANLYLLPVVSSSPAVNDCWRTFFDHRRGCTDR